MSQIHGKEPFHWHKADGSGKHNMTDPRKIPGYQRVYWDSDERDYVSHLEAHERAENFPERDRENDTEQISGLFDLIENREGQIRTARALIANLRRKAQQDAAQTEQTCM